MHESLKAPSRVHQRFIEPRLRTPGAAISLWSNKGPTFPSAFWFRVFPKLRYAVSFAMLCMFIGICTNYFFKSQWMLVWPIRRHRYSALAKVRGGTTRIIVILVSGFLLGDAAKINFKSVDFNLNLFSSPRPRDSSDEPH